MLNYKPYSIRTCHSPIRCLDYNMLNYKLTYIAKLDIPLAGLDYNMLNYKPPSPYVVISKYPWFRLQYVKL